MMNRFLMTSLLSVALMAASCAQSPDVPNISPQQTKSSLDKGTEVVVLDVRRPEEVDKGVIHPQVVTYNFYDKSFDGNLAQLDKDKTYYVYCHSGGRSSKTVKKMQDMGFRSVYNVDGGITKWQEEGLKLVERQQ